MKKFSSTIFITLFLLSFTFAESEKEVDQLNQKAESLLNQNPKESLAIAGNAKASAENIAYKKGQARAVALMGVANYKIDEYAKARIFINQAEALSQQINDTSAISFCKYWMANMELKQGQ